MKLTPDIPQKCDNKDWGGNKWGCQLTGLLIEIFCIILWICCIGTWLGKD